MENTSSHARKLHSQGVEDYIFQYPRPMVHVTPQPPTEEEEDDSPSPVSSVQRLRAAQPTGRRAVPGRRNTPAHPMHCDPPGLRKDAILRRTEWFKMKNRERVRLHLHHKKVESQQRKVQAHSSSAPPTSVSAIASILRQGPPPILRLLDPEDEGTFTTCPLLTVTLQDYFGTTNLFLPVPTEGMQAADVTRMVVQQQRHPQAALPYHYYRMLHVFTPHNLHTVAPDEMLVPQPPPRATTVHTDSTYLLTVATSHYKMEEDEKLEYCRDLLSCGKELQEARYSEVLRGRQVALQARVRTREDMLRLVKLIGRRELQLEGCSMDEVVQQLVQRGFSSDPEEMVYRCGEIDEFWKERYEDAHNGWHQLGGFPHTAGLESPKVVREQTTPHVTPSDMGPHGRHWYPDYLYLWRAVGAAMTSRQWLERLREELAHYRRQMHHLGSSTPMELFTDDREDLIEGLYEKALVQQAEEQQHAAFLHQLEAKQCLVSRSHLESITVPRQLPKDFNNFWLSVDMPACALRMHAYDLALKMAIKEFCDMRGYYLFRGTLMRLIRNDRRKILHMLKRAKRVKFGFLRQMPQQSSGEYCSAPPVHQDEGGSDKLEAPGEHSPHTPLHYKDKKYTSKGKISKSKQRRRLTHHPWTSKSRNNPSAGFMNTTNQQSEPVHKQHTPHNVCIQDDTDGEYEHHRNASSCGQRRGSCVPKQHMTGCVPKNHTNNDALDQQRSGSVFQHHTTGTGPPHAVPVTARVPDCVVTIPDSEEESDDDKIISSENEKANGTNFSKSDDRRFLNDGNETEVIVVHGESESDRNENKSDRGIVNESENSKVFDGKSEDDSILGGEDERECDIVLSDDNEREGDKVFGGSSVRKCNEMEGDSRVLSGQCDLGVDREGEGDLVLDRDYGDGDNILGGEGLNGRLPRGECRSEGDTAIASEKGDRFFVRRNESDMVSGRNDEGENNRVFRDGVCGNEISEGHETTHTGSGGPNRTYVSSQRCDSHSDSLSSDTSDEMKVFVGSSEVEATTPSHGKDSGDRAAETSNGTDCFITSNDDSNSNQDLANNDGDGDDNSPAGCDSNKSRTTGTDNVVDRLPNSYRESDNSSNEIISCDTSSDDEECILGLSNEKESYAALNHNSDNGCTTCNDNVDQKCNDAEKPVCNTHTETDDTSGKEKRGRRKMLEKEEGLWEPAGLTEPEGDLTLSRALQLYYGAIGIRLQEWDFYRYMVQVFHSTYKLECKRWHDVVKRTYSHITSNSWKLKRQREARVRASLYKPSKRASSVNTRMKCQGSKGLSGTDLLWLQNHVRWLLQYDRTLNVKHRALMHSLFNR